MCGIVGYLGNQEAWPIILEGLQRLEYRGYDSAGIAISDSSGKLHFRKTLGKVVGLVPVGLPDFPKGFAGIGHTRWATHGKPSDANAHPHTGCHGDIALVHNGIVENFLELKRRLQDQGHQFTSETDTEVITHLIEEGCAEGLSFENSFLRLGSLLKGSQAIAAMMQGETGKMCVMRLGNAGGIVVANLDGQSIVASDLPAMLPLLRTDATSPDVAFLEPGEMAVVTREGVAYIDLAGNDLNKQLRHVTPEDVLIDKGGYRHFMLKEINEQPQAVAAALRERVDFEQGRVHLPGFPISNADIKQ